MRPRRLVHRGAVVARGFAIDTAICGEVKARERVLAWWSPGVSVRAAGSVLLVLLPAAEGAAETTIAEEAPGAPLVLQGDLLSAAPLAEDEREAIAAPKGAIVLVRAGVAQAHDPESLQLLDPSEWIDTGAFIVHEPEPLGEPPAPPVLVTEPPAPDARAVFGATIPPPDPRAAEAHAQLGRARALLASGAANGPRAGLLVEGVRGIVRSIRGAAARSTQAVLRAARGRTAANGRTAAPARSGSVPGERRWSWLRALSRLFGRRAPEEASDNGRTAGAPAAGLLERLRDRLQDAMVRFLQLSRLSGLIGRRQAEYFSRLMDMFERGDLADALKHAIPLGSGGDDAPPRPALGMPGARPDLRIRPSAPGPRQSIAVDEWLFAELRARYRRAFERLVREGRVEEAAFVLAELLHESEEAVAFLERHGKLRLAAELAEVRRLAPELVVRQWFLAGDRERATQLARRHGAFAGAVARLEQSHPDLAEELRAEWAAVLAAEGDLVAAVDLVWPIPRLRDRALPWIERALDAGGAVEATMIVRALRLVPERGRELVRRALRIIEDEALELVSARAAFAGALVTRQGTRPAANQDPAAVLAGPVARALLRDAGAGRTILTRSTLERLTDVAADPLLRADLPPLGAATPESLRNRPEPLLVELAAADVGAVPVEDAVLLPNGHVLAALGEAGLRVVTREGKTACRLMEPADALVLASRGDRAIALARRGASIRAARIDLVTRRAAPWHEAAIGPAWARTFDGSTWLAAATGGNALEALDATAAGFRSLWRLGDVRPAAVARSEAQASLLCTAGGPEVWTFELPSFTLRARRPWPDTEESSPPTWALAPNGDSARAWILPAPQNPQGALLRIDLYVQTGQHVVLHDTCGDERVLDLVLFETWVIAVTAGPAGAHVRLIDREQGIERARITLRGARRATVSASDRLLVAADDRGRIVVLDHLTGQLVRTLRLGA